MKEALYILIRTSNRPNGFKSLIQSIKALDWDNKIVVVHTDDPRDKYVEGDIIIRGEAHLSNIGKAPYNLYNNKLLEQVKDGWVHFIDDDDRYCSPDVFNILLEDAKKSEIQIGKVKRWNNQIFPKQWKTQRSFQTECFCCYSDIAKTGRWWSEKGGDHYYTRQLTRRTKLRWVDVLIAEAQNGKGNGNKIDIDNTVNSNVGNIPDDEPVWIKLYRGYGKLRATNIEEMPYYLARTFEERGYGKVTYKGNSLCMQKQNN
jgi:hypothetical protein